MRTLENATLMANGSACLTFRPAVPADGQYYIQIENGTGCSSYVSHFIRLFFVHIRILSFIKIGRYTGYTLNRTVTLEIPSCIDAGVIEHELIHALGQISYLLFVLIKLNFFRILSRTITSRS